MFAYDNLYVEYENTRILTYPCIGPQTAIRSIDFNDSSTVCAKLSIYIDDDTIILRGLKIKTDIGYSMRYAGLFLVFH